VVSRSLQDRNFFTCRFAHREEEGERKRAPPSMCQTTRHPCTCQISMCAHRHKIMLVSLRAMREMRRKGRACKQLQVGEREGCPPGSQSRGAARERGSKGARATTTEQDALACWQASGVCVCEREAQERACQRSDLNPKP
jgi:hypothetical protein